MYSKFPGGGAKISNMADRLIKYKPGSPTPMGPKCEVWRRCNENCGRRYIYKFYLFVFHIRKKWGVQIARNTPFFGISPKKIQAR